MVPDARVRANTLRTAKGVRVLVASLGLLTSDKLASDIAGSPPIQSKPLERRPLSGGPDRRNLTLGNFHELTERTFVGFCCRNDCISNALSISRSIMFARQHLAAMVERCRHIRQSRIVQFKHRNFNSMNCRIIAAAATINPFGEPNQD